MPKSLKNILFKVGEFQSKVLLSIIFVIALPLFVFIARIQHKETRGWVRWRYESESLEDVSRQF